MSAVFDHPWLSGLFGDADTAALWSADAHLKHMIGFEAAYSRALGAVGVASPEVAAAAARAIEAARIDTVRLANATATDGLPVPDLVAQLKAAAREAAAAVHKGATSQDVIDTALACSLRDSCTLLRGRITALASNLADLRDRHGTRSLMGRTRMQAALPITVGDRIDTWMRPLADHLDRLDRLAPQVAKLQFGGPVGTREGLNGHGEAIAAHLARELGLANGPQWHARRDGIAEFAGLLSLISGSLGKMGQDIALMAQQSPPEISIAGGGASSAMPHKQNPVLAELLMTLARFNATQLSGMHQSLIHEQERSGAAWALEWMILPQMVMATGRSLSAATELCDTLRSVGPSGEHSL